MSDLSFSSAARHDCIGRRGKGGAHTGLRVLSDEAISQYKCDNFYAPEADGGISILDESLGIDWRIPMDKAILSEKDTKHSLLKDFESPFFFRTCRQKQY